MLKRIFSLLLLFTFYCTLPAQAVGSDAMLRAGTTLYADPEESSILLVTDEPKRVEIQDATETHTSVTLDAQQGFVRNDDILSAVTRYVQTETDALDATGNPVATLAAGTAVDVFELEGELLLTLDGTYVARDALGETMPEAVTRYAKAGAVVLSAPDGDVIAELETGETLEGLLVGSMIQINTTDGYGYVTIDSTSTSPVKTGTQFVLTTSPYTDASGKTTGSLVRGDKTSVYGTIGDMARLFKNGAYVYMKRDVLAGKMPRYTKTGSRYALGAIDIYQDTDKKQVVGSLKRSQLVSVYGTDGDFTRIYTRDQFLFVETKSLGKTKPAPLKTGQRYITKSTPIYARTILSSKTSLSLKRGQLVSIYGTKGNYTRIFTKGNYYFIPTSVTSTKKPPRFESTETRYSRYDEVEVYASTSVVKQVGSLKRGQVVETFGTSGYYTRIRLNGAYRYVATGYLGVSRPTAKPKAGTVFYTQFNGTPYFSADVAYGRPAGTLPRGTKLVGLRSIDADFWHVRLSSGKRVYVLNPYIAETKPKAVQPASVYTAAHYGTTKKTPFYANPNDTRPIGYLDAGRRIYPRGKSGDSYLIQYDWRPVYVKTKDVRIKQDALLKKRDNSQKERLINAAVKHLGTPYTWGSQSPLNGGFDCSGLIHYATNQAGKVGGRTNVSGYWYSGHFKNKRTGITSGRRGDIVFFAGTYKSGPSHIGIMLDDEFFIHAGGEMLQINSVHDPMWRPNFLGYKSL
ncbi:C40 family peptidase [Exiguobacterium marinum]|uniref:C40 family peptidase n=1 Tax=Exiguobacterium marinum TaxID=273528 RepID=A0ABY7WWX0_9BACL|nr:C40 family peptidase [Exiguobacterium marinum]WDH75368.1 C40 family peptidase [Exiguobacterium marinum]